MRFCQSKQLHLISDEIYALGTYQRTDRQSQPFVSVLSIDYQQYIDLNLVHVLYGLSKDYGLGGLRLGCVISRNMEFSQAARGLWYVQNTQNLQKHRLSMILVVSRPHLNFL
jgi:1-aminocyclopropane-1-carboxylate synthase